VYFGNNNRSNNHHNKMLETGKKIIESIFLYLTLFEKKNSRKWFFFTCFFWRGKNSWYTTMFMLLSSVSRYSFKSIFPEPTWCVKCLMLGLSGHLHIIRRKHWHSAWRRGVTNEMKKKAKKTLQHQQLQ